MPRPLIALLLVFAAPFATPHAQTAGLAIRNVTVVPATGGPSIHAATVLIRGDRIAVVGPAHAVAIPAGVRVVDGTGQFLLPGLIDLHIHLSKTRGSAMGLLVANGVTTVRDMGGEYEELLRWRREVVAGKRLGPRILMPGPILESPANIARMRKDPPSERVEPFDRMRIAVGSPQEARETVARLAAMEIDFIKIRTVRDRETYLALNAAANEHGVPLVGHVPPYSAAAILEAGQDGVDHGFARAFDNETREERLATWRRFAAAGVPVVPTLTVGGAILTQLDRLRAIVEDDAGKIEPRRPYLSKFLIRDWREQFLEQSVEGQERFRKFAEQGRRDIREMHEAGIDVLAGTDTGVLNLYPGSSVHDELASFVKDIGMTPAEAIERATRRSAKFLRIGDSVGTVERGKIADLMLVDRDPLLDITNTRRISAVILRGVYYDRAGLETIRAQVLAAPDITVDDWGRNEP